MVIAKGVTKGIILVVAFLVVQVTVGLLIVKYLDEAFVFVEVPIFIVFMALCLKLFYRKDISN